MPAASRQRIVVTGAGGFVGGHVLHTILAADDPPEAVWALDLAVPGGPQDDRIRWLACDVTDPRAVSAAMSEARPDGVIHLVGIARGDDLGAFFRINVAACQNVLSAASGLARPPRVVVIGSAAEYGITTGRDVVVREDRPLLATTTYGLTKVMQEQWALAYAREKHLPVVCVRPFNIIGPGQPTGLVPAAFLRQVADVVAGRSDVVRVGNTATHRDFVDVRDVAAAIWALLQAGSDVDGEVFNIASGQPVKIADILQACIDLSGREIPVEEDPARQKAVDVRSIVGDISRIQAATSWEPNMPWRRSLKEMWRDLCIP